MRRRALAAPPAHLLEIHGVAEFTGAGSSRPVGHVANHGIDSNVGCAGVGNRCVDFASSRGSPAAISGRLRTTASHHWQATNHQDRPCRRHELLSGDSCTLRAPRGTTRAGLAPQAHASKASTRVRPDPGVGRSTLQAHRPPRNPVLFSISTSISSLSHRNITTQTDGGPEVAGLAPNIDLARDCGSHPAVAGHRRTVG